MIKKKEKNICSLWISAQCFVTIQLRKELEEEELEVCVAIYYVQSSVCGCITWNIAFLYFFPLITEEGSPISPCYSLELCFQMGISFLFLFAFHFSFLSYL